ncbi:YggS family pyridoxal phosphate-dependent enzyme [Enterococcus casseliflavus]|uniref:YggS family pyridoxal phosphate-dependent enzyme n=1 Tax=Enterococcus casseliflavus TaxID=37734 RepID=UPI00115F2C1B|nr:YggS family pyridoxal phosphate-dependent enzyme [Enterococcus casseliflavus]MBO6348700.1 YggS family pyridoxal phosphate-dependent enzyme [Enterococcus casseliflavus]MBO6366378.1 YggS family pyridoxal phosphate-dependent enzyme [Enterococcus casseliflavus]
MISENLHKIQQEIQDSCALVSRNASDVCLTAVTKSVDTETTRVLLENGVRDCAENRVEKLLEKKAALKDYPDVRWHFIGNLQRRKVKSIINEIDFFHALDSIKLAQEIQKRAEHPINCFVEVNVSQEATKQGIFVEEVMAFIEALASFDKIRVVGLMTMAPLTASKDEQYQIFKELKRIQQQIADLHLTHAPCLETSMGMSNDFPIAIQEGATFIRVGTALFQ